MPLRLTGGISMGEFARKILIVFFLALVWSLASPASDALSSEPEIVPQVGHPNGVTWVAVTPDGRNIVSGSIFGFVKLWDFKSGAVVRSFRGQENWSASIAASPDGRYVAGGSFDGTIALWDRATGELIRTYSGHKGSVNAVQVTPDGKHVVSGGKDIKIWNLATGELLRTLKIAVYSLAMTSDGRHIVASGDKKIRVWDFATGALTGTFEGDSVSALTPDDRQFITLKDDKIIELRDLETGAVIRSFQGHEDRVLAFKVTPDGRYIVSSSADDSIRLWDLSTGAEIRSFRSSSSSSSSFAIAVSPDSQTLVAGRTNNTIELWDLATGKQLHTFQGSHLEVRTMAVSLDGKHIVAGNEAGIIQVWDSETGALVNGIQAHSKKGYRASVSWVKVTSDGRYIVSSSGEDALKVWDLATGAPVRSFDVPDRYFSMSPDGRHILVSAPEGGELLNIETGKRARSFKAAGSVTPDGRYILDVGETTTRLWDLATGALVRSFKGVDKLASIAIAPDAQFMVSGSSDHSRAELRSLATGELIRSFETRLGWVNAVTITPDGRQAVSGNTHGKIQLWDLATGALVKDYAGHHDAITSLAVRGSRLFSASNDGTIRIWDLASGRPLVTLMGGVIGNQAGGAVALTPQGFFATDQGNYGSAFLKVVDGLDVYDVRQFYQALYRPDLVSELLKGDPSGKYELAAGNLNIRKIIDSGRPPRVELKRTERIGDSVRMTVEIANQGGGIGKVEWRVDDVLLAGERGMTPVGEADGVLTETRSFPLTAAGNAISITAYNEAGLITAVPLVEQVDGSGITDSEKARLFIFAVGIDDYAQSSLRLNYAVNDAQAFSSRFKTAAEGLGLFKEISVKSLTNAEVTKEGLDRAFTELAGQMGPEDKFVFFAAGHGKVYKDRYYFYPQDLRFGAGDAITSQGIDQDTWQAWFSRIPALASVLIYDTCEAGQMTMALRGGDDMRTAIDLLNNATGRSILAATTAQDAAREGFEDHGVFTYALLKALSEGDQNGDGQIEVIELGQYVERTVPVLTDQRWGIAQRPRFTIQANFPIAARMAPETTGLAFIPQTATHVIITPVTVAATGRGSAAGGKDLPPGTTVRVLKSEGESSLIARDGQELGLVPATSLAPLH